MGQTLAAVFRLTDQYTAVMQKIIKSSDDYKKKSDAAEQATDRLKRGLKDLGTASQTTSNSLGGVIGKITGLVSAAALGKKAVTTLFDAIKTVGSTQVSQSTFKALTGSGEAGTALYSYIGEYAKTSALGRSDLANATTSFLAFTKDIDKIEQLNKLVERLYAKDPTQGAAGAVFALKEVLSGDTMSIKDRFNMSGISGEKIRNLTNAGDIQGTIDYLDEVFNKFGATQEVVDENFNSLITQANIFTSNLTAAMGDEANPAVQSLSQTFQRLNADMDAGKFQPFFNLIAIGTQTIANVLAFLAENGKIVVPVIFGIATALVVYHTVSKIAATVTGALGIVMNAATGNWIGLGAAILGVVGAIVAYNKMDSAMNTPGSDVGKTLEQAKREAEKAMSGAKLDDTTLNTKITNDTPIAVKGEVEIEKENMKYLFDIASQKFFASFSASTIAPQLNIYGQTVQQTADVDEVMNHMAERLVEMTEVQPQGAY